MERYLIAWKKQRKKYEEETSEKIEVKKDLNDALFFLSNITTKKEHELISIVKYDFENNDYVVMKLVLDDKTKLCLVEENE